MNEWKNIYSLSEPLDPSNNILKTIKIYSYKATIFFLKLKKYMYFNW